MIREREALVRPGPGRLAAAWDATSRPGSLVTPRLSGDLEIRPA